MHQQGKINREDMLELTRRMTLSRNCFSRIAGAYFDEEGYIDGTFNRHFRKLTVEEQKFNLELAKAIPFSETNKQLKEYRFDPADEKPGTVWQILMALTECGLKNDALLDVLYELVGERYHSSGPFAFYGYILSRRKWGRKRNKEIYVFYPAAGSALSLSKKEKVLRFRGDKNTSF